MRGCHPSKCSHVFLLRQLPQLSAQTGTSPHKNSQSTLTSDLSRDDLLLLNRTLPHGPVAQSLPIVSTVYHTAPHPPSKVLDARLGCHKAIGYCRQAACFSFGNGPVESLLNDQCNWEVCRTPLVYRTPQVNWN